jgi:hypothetical protein
MKTCKEFLADENGIDYFIIEISDTLVSELALINEGRWVQSRNKDWMRRVDGSIEGVFKGSYEVLGLADTYCF